MTRLDRQQGFTLIELLVASLMSIIILFALSTILVVTLDQTQHTGAQVNADGQARTALATIENDLHSACVGGNVAPIQAGSTGTDLDFITYSGTSDAVGTSSATMPVWNDISFANGTLVDKTYSTTAAAGGGYTQGSQTGSIQLLGKVSTLGSNPVFQYFAYQPYGPAADGNYYWTIPDGSNPQPITGATLSASPLTTPLGATDASNAVEVLIDLTVGSLQSSGPGASVGDPVTDSISLRITPAPNYSSSSSDTADFAPCQ
jgi:prepilin-type N-terminal cleavage/methylation domain-containing protein